MSNTCFDVVVFDFDGTLIQSAEAKRRAFFEIFPAHYAASVEAVLSRHPEESRHTVIPRILEEMKASASLANSFVQAYASIVETAIRSASELPGAEQVLQLCARHMAVYVSSMTPQDQLETLLQFRGWRKYFSGAFGYPCEKVETVALLLSRHVVPPSRLLVVGDGRSDFEAAKRNKCSFHRINTPSDLGRVPEIAGLCHA